MDDDLAPLSVHDPVLGDPRSQVILGLLDQGHRRGRRTGHLDDQHGPDLQAAPVRVGHVLRRFGALSPGGQSLGDGDLGPDPRDRPQETEPTGQEQGDRVPADRAQATAPVPVPSRPVHGRPPLVPYPPQKLRHFRLQGHLDQLLDRLPELMRATPPRWGLTSGSLKWSAGAWRWLSSFPGPPALRFARRGVHRPRISTPFDVPLAPSACLRPADACNAQSHTLPAVAAGRSTPTRCVHKACIFLGYDRRPTRISPSSPPISFRRFSLTTLPDASAGAATSPEAETPRRRLQLLPAETIRPTATPRSQLGSPPLVLSASRRP